MKKKMSSLRPVVFGRNKAVMFYKMELDSIALNNAHIKVQNLLVSALDERYPRKMVRAKRFYFQDSTVGGLLLQVLKSTGRLAGLQNVIHSGGIINNPKGQDWGGGFDIIIEREK